MRRKRKTSQDEFFTTCSWCGGRISEDSEIYSLGATTKPGVDLSRQEGTIIPLRLMITDKTIEAFVPLNDSDAKREGNDFLFVLCSRKCGIELKTALELDKDLIERIN